MVVKGLKAKWFKLLLLFLVFFGVQSLSAQVTTLQNWSALYNSTATSLQTVAYPVPGGSDTNRVLAVAIACNPATPIPYINTLEGIIVPAAVIIKGNILVISLAPTITAL